MFPRGQPAGVGAFLAILSLRSGGAPAARASQARGRAGGQQRAMSRQTTSPFQAVSGLGQLRKEYTRGTRGGCVFVAVGLALAAGGLALAIAGASAAPSGLIDQPQLVVMLIGAAVLFLMGVVLLVSAWFTWTVTAALFEHGVALRTPQGVRQAAWADVTAIYVHVVRQPGWVTAPLTHRYTLETKTGARLVFDDSIGGEVGQLGSALQLGVANTHFARYWSAYQSGQRVTFGPLALDRQKLYVNTQELPWSAIRSVKIEQGTVWIEKTDQGWIRWTAVSVPEVPNLLIFQNLVGRLTRTV